MLATIMQGVDNTIANVALPHMQGSLSVSQDQIAWLLTSYMVSAAIMMPLTGWLAGQFGIKYIFLVSVLGFTVFSALAGSATSLPQLVIYRVMQGICGAALVPLSQSVLLSINPPERHGPAMAVWGMGVMLGPIMGPAVGGWLTEEYSWRWVFYINVPIGIVAALGILILIPQTRPTRRVSFRFFCFLILRLRIGGLQLMLDRGRRLDWFYSTEICIEATVAALAFYLLTVHTITATDRSFLSRELLKSPNFATGTMLMFLIGGILSGTLGLIPTMLQHLMHYPVMTTGLVRAAGGFGRLGGRVSLWWMTGFSLLMGMGPIICSGLLQGFGLGCTFVPLNTLALSNLPRDLLTQGTALRSVFRNVGGSMGIAILVNQLTSSTQLVHARLIEHLRPDNPLMQSSILPPPFSLSRPSGIAALNAEVTRQAEMVAYVHDFALMLLLVLLAMPFLLLVRRPRPKPAPAAE